MSELAAYHCTPDKALKMERVMSIITQVVNLIRAKGLTHRQFKSFKFGMRWLALLHRGVMAKPGKAGDLGVHGKQRVLCDITSHLNSCSFRGGAVPSLTGTAHQAHHQTSKWC